MCTVYLVRLFDFFDTFDLYTHLCRLEQQRSGPECRHLSQLGNVRTSAPAGMPEYALNKENAAIRFENQCEEIVSVFNNALSRSNLWVIFLNTSVQTSANKLPEM